MIRTAAARNGSGLLAALVTCLVCLSCVSMAAAQSAHFVDDSRGMDVHLFRPALDSKGFIGVNGTSVLGDRDYSFGLVLVLGYHIFPLHAFEYDEARKPEDAKDSSHLVTAAIAGTLHFNYGLG